ncbi:hypothetical protein ARNL5_02327 [Anaerolineae bacterium]|nr:hypothetical protein ARNL5_02327 [Anaerolineae bacterium]
MPRVMKKKKNSLKMPPLIVRPGEDYTKARRRWNPTMDQCLVALKESSEILRKQGWEGLVKRLDRKIARSKRKTSKQPH